MSSNSKAVLYALECGHAAPGPATLVNGVLACAWCLEPRTIVSIIEYEWHAKCRNCTFSRWAGLSRHNAELFAAGHTRHSREHIVTVEYAKNSTAVETAAKFAKWQELKTG